MSEETTAPTLTLPKTISDDEVDDVSTTPSQRVSELTTVDRENTSPVKNYIHQTPEQISTIQFENEISPVATNGNLNRPCAWQNMMVGRTSTLSPPKAVPTTNPAELQGNRELFVLYSI
ncbi:hypothetical protein QTP88_017050 [Uroleucon formosanum]